MSLQTRFVFKQGAIYGLGNVLTKFSGLLLIMLYMKFISATEFGAVALFETIFQFILLLSGLGVKGGFNRWYHDMSDGDDKKALFLQAGVLILHPALWRSLWWHCSFGFLLLMYLKWNCLAGC